MAKRPQSGDIDIAFDRIFTHSSARPAIALSNGGEGGSPQPRQPDPGGGRGGQRRPGRQRKPEAEEAREADRQAEAAAGRQKQARKQPDPGKRRPGRQRRQRRPMRGSNERIQ